MCAKTVPALLELASLTFEIVELTVYNDVDAPVFVGNRLIAGGEIDNAQTGVTQTDPLVIGNPNLLMIRPAMNEGFRSALKRLSRNTAAT